MNPKKLKTDNDKTTQQMLPQSICTDIRFKQYYDKTCMKVAPDLTLMTAWHIKTCTLQLRSKAQQEKQKFVSTHSIPPKVRKFKFNKEVQISFQLALEQTLVLPKAQTTP